MAAAPLIVMHIMIVLLVLRSRSRILETASLLSRCFRCRATRFVAGSKLEPPFVLVRRAPIQLTLGQSLTTYDDLVAFILIIAATRDNLVVPLGEVTLCDRCFALEIQPGYTNSKVQDKKSTDGSTHHWPRLQSTSIGSESSSQQPSYLEPK